MKVSENNAFRRDICSAFYLGELSSIMIAQWNIVKLISPEFQSGSWHWILPQFGIDEETETFARGRLLVHLLTNKIITIEQLNIKEPDEEKTEF